MSSEREQFLLRILRRCHALKITIYRLNPDETRAAQAGLRTLALRIDSQRIANLTHWTATDTSNARVALSAIEELVLREIEDQPDLPPRSPLASAVDALNERIVEAREALPPEALPTWQGWRGRAVDGSAPKEFLAPSHRYDDGGDD